MGVRVVVPNVTVAPAVKLLPLTVRLKPGVFSMTELGLNEVITGGRNWKAPTLTVLLKVRGKPVPRWSVVSPAGIRLRLPALMATLPGKRASVSVVPPLFSSGPRLSVDAVTSWSLPLLLVLKPVAPAVLLKRLLPALVKLPKASGA